MPSPTTLFNLLSKAVKAIHQYDLLGNTYYAVKLADYFKLKEHLDELWLLMNYRLAEFLVDTNLIPRLIDMYYRIDSLGPERFNDLSSILKYL